MFFDRSLSDEERVVVVHEPERSVPETPAVAAVSPPSLRTALAQLRVESRRDEPRGERLSELALAVLNDVAALTFERRAMLMRVPGTRRSTREELLRRLARAEAYLLQPAHAQATLEGAESSAALSQFHLIRIFRAVYGTTPLAWSCGKRLDAARDAVLLTNDSIEAVARARRLRDRTAFDRAFRRRFGETPGRLRTLR